VLKDDKYVSISVSKFDAEEDEEREAATTLAQLAVDRLD
jgi:hypothetical protein